MPHENPSQSIGNLLVQLCKLRRNKSNLLLTQQGIHDGQDILLYHLSREDGQTISSLGEKMCIQPATISNMLDRMEAHQLVRKEKDALDKRTSRVYMEPKGQVVMKQVGQIWHTMENQTLQGLSADEQATLRILLQKMLSNLT